MKKGWMGNQKLPSIVSLYLAISHGTDLESLSLGLGAL